MEIERGTCLSRRNSTVPFPVGHRSWVMSLVGFTDYRVDIPDVAERTHTTHPVPNSCRFPESSDPAEALHGHGYQGPPEGGPQGDQGKGRCSCHLRHLLARAFAKAETEPSERWKVFHPNPSFPQYL